MFTVKKQDKLSKARTGVLKTKHGKLKTPYFMPVATKAAAKYISSLDLKELGTQCFISNGFIVSLRPGLETIEKFGGIHGFMNWNGGIFTDNGGFQMMDDSFYISADKKGVWFKNPFSGSKEHVTPEKILHIMFTEGSDVAMAFDHITKAGAKKTEAKNNMELTHLWQQQCKEIHDEKYRKHGQLLFGIAQGGNFKDLRRESAEFVNSLDFDGIAIGGLAIGEGPEVMMDMVDASRPFFNEDKPVYFMGLGSPDDILDCVERGIDIFDSAYPTYVARHNTLFTRNGKIKMTAGKHKHDKGPIDPWCDCYACTHYSKGYIRHLMTMKEPLGMRLVSLHNIRFLHKMLEEARKHIEKGTFKKWKDEFVKNYRGK
jgi:queuine tRNA-ribosyltransferase